MDFYNVDRVMYAAGLCVNESLRGRGIATEILKTRTKLMQTIGLEVTTSIFSTVGAQKAAKAAGYDENLSLSYEEFQEKFPKMNFSNAFGGSCKILSLRV